MLVILSWTLTLFGALPLGLAAFILLKKLKGKPERKLHVDKWKKDMVYLCQFPLVPKVRTISPFALKLETWLRMTGIEYQNIETMEFSEKGQIPYIEFNGVEIPDSNIIIRDLKAHFGKDPDSQYGEKDLCLGHIVTMMVENFTAHTGFHYRYGYHMKEFLEHLKIADYYPSKNGIRMWGFVQPYLTRFRSYLQGMGRHDNQDVWEFARKDLKALSALLGEKKYFLGQTPSTVDCVLFGHLAQFLYIDIGFPQKKCLEEECGNLVQLVERIKADYWPDWDEIQTQTKKIN